VKQAGAKAAPATARRVNAALSDAGLPEAEGGSMPGVPVTRGGWHAWKAPGEVRVTHWDVTFLTGAEKVTALGRYAPVLSAAGWKVTADERGGFLAVTAPKGNGEGDD
jgi:hypothetical protein